MKIAHIINPVVVDKSSDLFPAQPITFETMRRARNFAAPEISVDLFSAQFPEDKLIVPVDFTQTPDLDRSVLDVAEFKTRWKLPLLKDILDRLYEASSAEYFIYTNVDIALQPQFYRAVKSIIRQGYDSFVINRRSISDGYSAVTELEMMYAEPGQLHRGWDCFVYPRRHYSNFKLYNICLGVSRAGLALLANLFAFSQEFKEFKDAHLTFHIGDSRSRIQKDYKDYYAHNTLELMRILSDLEMECGPFPRASIPGSFLHRRRTFGSLYDAWSQHIYLPAGLSRFINRISGRQ